MSSFGNFAIGMHSIVLAQEVGPALSAAMEQRTEAVRMAREGNFAQALQIMENAMGSTGDTPNLSYDYVVMLSWSGKHAAAIKSFEEFRVSQAVPDYVLPEVAASYRFIGKYNKSMQQYSKYLALHPGDHTAIKGIIYCYLDNGKTEKALNFISRLEKEHPDQTLMLKSLYADILFQKGDIEQALQFYSEAFRDNPDDTDAARYKYYIWIYTKLNPSFANI